MKAQASSIASTDVSLASPQFAISRPCETAKLWQSLPRNAELSGYPRGGLFSTGPRLISCCMAATRHAIPKEAEQFGIKIIIAHDEPGTSARIFSAIARATRTGLSR